MRPRQLLSSLIVPTTALALPRSPSSPTSPLSPRTPSGASTPEPAQTCGLYRFAESPKNPPACWAWYASSDEPSNYCGASTFSPVAAAAFSTSSTAPSTSWLDSCAALRDAQLTERRDFFLAQYAIDRFNTLLTSGACAFQVQPGTPPSSDQVYVGGTDIADVLGSAIDVSRAAKGNGVEGSMTCSPGSVRWRMVPI
ncbi:hypothetical protein AAE478_005247 [Parahypoxylon ruwenzoriense]